MSRRRFKTFGTNLISAIALLILDKNILLNVVGVPTQCINYRNLTEENRNRNISEARIPVCETLALQIGWYRFMNKAGNILTSKPVEAGMCSALNPGRLLGSHPCTIHKTIDAQVCFVDQNDCGKRVDISITLCGEYYVYRLPALNCSREMRGRYCGEDSKVPISSCNTTNINPTKSFAVRTTNQESTPTLPSSNKRVSELKKQIDELNRSDAHRKDVVQKVIYELTNLTDLNKKNEDEQESGLERQVLNDTVQILQKIINLNISDSNIDIMAPASNILDARNTKSWRKIKDDQVIRDLIVTLENYGFQNGENIKYNSNATTGFIFRNHSNVHLHVKYINKASQMSPEERSFTFPQASFNLSTSALPPNSSAIVVVMWHKTLHSFLTNTLHDNEEINSKIITASVRPKPIEKFSQPVRITWNIRKLNDSATCVFWKPETNQKNWKSDGCFRVKKRTESNRLICECDHLTAFAVMDISRDMVNEAERHALELISTIGCSVSLLGIFLTMLTHALLWKRLQHNTKTKVPSQVLMHLCSAIGMTDILAILAGPAQIDKNFCTAVSILLYFFVLAVFGWMLCEGIIIYLQLVNVYTGLGLGGRHLKVFYVIGWGVPVVVVSVLVGLNDRNDFITKHACWCRGDGVLFWTFVGTIGLILLINLVIFTLALRSALSSSEVNTTRTQSATKHGNTGTKAATGTTLRKAKVGMKGSAILLPLLGLTWIFGLLVFNRETIVFKYLFAICNSLQGMMIFLFHVLINRKVHEAISREKKTRKARQVDNIVINNACGTLSTSEGNRRKSSIPVTPTFLKKRSDSVVVIQNNNLSENNNGLLKPVRLHLQPDNVCNADKNKSNSRSKEVKYTTKKENVNLNLAKKKSPSQCKGVILEDLEIQ